MTPGLVQLPPAQKLSAAGQGHLPLPAGSFQDQQPEVVLVFRHSPSPRGWELVAYCIGNKPVPSPNCKLEWLAWPISAGGYNPEYPGHGSNPTSVNHLERCQSGRLGRSRKPVSRQLDRGFESLPLRFANRCGLVRLRTRSPVCSGVSCGFGNCQRWRCRSLTTKGFITPVS